MYVYARLRHLLVVVFLFTCLVPASHALDAAADGEWISLGYPSYIHQGTEGSFFLNGSNQGSCAGVRPRYFRVDTSQPHWKEFYAWLLLMSVSQRTLDCVVVSGCGSTEVWVRYCRGSLQ